jgi:acetyl/propionyl-CoA carboxylase alpha subunit
LKTFKKILVANRGEIAVRIIRAAREMGILSLAIYTNPDEHSLHVDQADEAVLLQGESLSDSYLDQKQIIRIALENRVDAIHPGYGFLAEHAEFAEAVLHAGIQFIGPTPGQIRLMGQKDRAVELAKKLSIPVLYSEKGTKDELVKVAKNLGFPLMVKAVAGGGGKGMRVISSEKELAEAIEKAECQALEYFGNGDLMLERYVPDARHIEVQLLGDHYGNLVHLFERECSIQRRFQKVVEEAPSAFVNNNLREKLCHAALTIGREAGYHGLGTIEFLVDEDSNFWFLEMNTRIQVEHPVTEAVTGIDLVKQQIWIAAGNVLQLKQNEIKLKGHAIEARICAEDAGHDFRPSTGTIQQVVFPEKDGIRTDHFLQPGAEISPAYDSLLAKQIAHMGTRPQALNVLSENLKETLIKGVETNLSFVLQLLENERFQKNEISTSFLKGFEPEKQPDLSPVVAAYLFFHLFRKIEKPRNIWQQIGFRTSFPVFRIWVDGIENEGSVIFVQDGIQLRFNGVATNFRLTEISAKRMIIRSDNTQFILYPDDQKNQTEIYFRGRTVALRSNLVPEQVKIEKQVKETKRFQEKINSDLFGKVLGVAVQPGDRVLQGDVLLVLESMKTEFQILCPQNAIVKNILVQTGDRIKDRQLLVELSEESCSSWSQFPDQVSEDLTSGEILNGAK